MSTSEKGEERQLSDKTSSEDKMLSILKGNKEIIIDHISKLKDGLAQINGNIYGKWDWPPKSDSNKKHDLDIMINDTLLKFTKEISSIVTKETLCDPSQRVVNENDFDHFVDVLLSNIYSLSKNDVRSKEILETALQASRKIKSNATTLEKDKRQKNAEEDEINNPFFVEIWKEPSKPSEQKILTLQTLLEAVKRGTKISNDTLDKLVEATHTMPPYLQMGFTTNLLMLGEICSALKISLKSKNLDIWIAISDYCHKIFASGKINRYTYVMPSNSIPPITISVPDYLKDNKKLFRLFEELSAVASCLSVCGNEEKNALNKEKKKMEEDKRKRLHYIPHKLYNSGQNDLAIEFLKNGECQSNDLTMLKLKCLVHFAAGHYKQVTEEYETYIKDPAHQTDDRSKSVYMLSNAFLYKFENKFIQDWDDHPEKGISLFIDNLDNTPLPEDTPEFIRQKLYKVVETLWKSKDNNMLQGSGSNEYFNSNNLFVFHCFKMYDKIIEDISKINFTKKSNNSENLHYFGAFAHLEKIHKEKFKKMKADRFRKFLKNNFRNEYVNTRADLYQAYDHITKAFSINPNLFLRTSHFLNVAPKVDEDTFEGNEEYWLKCLYFIFLTFKIQDRLAIHSGKLENDTIGTYMPLERYRQNIAETKEHKLPLLNATTMNDPMEGELLKLNSPKDKEDFKELYDPKVFIRALSTLKDNLPMWDRYADNGKGVCAMIDRKMLYRSNTDLQPRDSSKYYSSKILRLEDSRKMYRVAYLKPDDKKPNLKPDDKKPKQVKVVHVGGLKKTGKKDKQTNEIDYEHYLRDINNLVEKYLLLGDHLLEERTDGKSMPKIIAELVQYYHNKIRYLFKSSDFESEEEIRLLSFNYSTKESIKLPDRYFHYVYWPHQLKIEYIVIGPRVKDFRSLVPYLEDNVLETKRSIFMSEIETKNVERSKVNIE